MKKILITFVIAASLVACKNDDKQAAIPKEKRDLAVQDTANYTSIQWLDSTTVDLGTVKEGKLVEVAFRFKNTGTKNLVIDDVSAECGCTIPEKPEQPFTPGEEGVIKAKFNSKGRTGTNTKRITVTSNTNPNSQKLTFNVEVN